jgi:2'-5' RNA ligase
VTGGPSRTALVVTADAAERVLAPWRRRHNRSAVEHRIPAHVTILFPLVPAAEVDEPLLARLAELYARIEPFSFDLARLDSFPDAAWLHPEPAVPFHALIDRTCAAFPDSPPYGNPSLAPVPHCTVGIAEGPARLAAMMAELQAGLAPLLPIRCEATAVSLLEERHDATWPLRARFPLRGVR